MGDFLSTTPECAINSCVREMCGNWTLVTQSNVANASVRSFIVDFAEHKCVKHYALQLSLQLLCLIRRE